MPLRFSLLLLFLFNGFQPLAAAPSLSTDECLRRSDELAGSQKMTPEALKAWLKSLEKLDSDCAALPQLKHNLGVLHARNGDWDKAVAHLEASLALDERAAHTAGELRRIHRFHAVHAYREALQSNNPPPEPPTLEFQNSALENFSATAEPQSLSNNDAGQAINALLLRWAAYAGGETAQCEQCFSDGLTSAEQNLSIAATRADSGLPEHSLIDAGQYRVVIVQSPDSRAIALRLALIASGQSTADWRIDRIQVVP